MSFVTAALVREDSLSDFSTLTKHQVDRDTNILLLRHQ